MSKKAIILLYPISNPDTAKWMADLKKSCKQEKLSIVHTIQPRDEYDYEALNELIETVQAQEGKVAVIIDERIIKYSIYKIAWCVLAVLCKTSPTEIWLYEIDEEDVSFIFRKAAFTGLEQNREDLLKRTSVYLNYLMSVFTKNM